MPKATEEKTISSRRPKPGTELNKKIKCLTEMSVNFQVVKDEALKFQMVDAEQ